MVTVPPPTTPPLPPTVAAQPAPVLLILAPPPAVAALPAGAVMDGVVLPQPPASPDADARAVTVRTPQGDITIRLPAPLPPGTDVELQVVRASPDQATVRLVAVDNQPAAQVLAQLRQAATPTPQQPLPQTPTPPAVPTATLPPANAWTPQGPVALPALGTVSAYVIQGVTPPSVALQAPALQTNVPTPIQPFSLSTGGELAVRISAVQLPQAETPALPPIPTGATILPQPAAQPALQTTAQPVVQSVTPPPAIQGMPAAPTSPAVPSASAAAPAQIATPIVAPVITPLTATPTALIPPTAVPAPQPTLTVAGPQGLPPPIPAPPVVQTPEPPQAVITGVVTRATATSPPVITTDLGEIQLNLRANLPVGTRVTLDVLTQLPPQTGSSPPPLPLGLLPLSGPPAGGTTVGWPNVSEALVQLQRADPAAASEFAAAIPDGGPRTTAAIIAFAQAMRSGDPRSWPGDTNLRALERLGPRGAHLAAQIGDEVAGLSARARDSAGPEWRALPVPWNADGRIDRITLITRREGEADDTGGGKKGRGGGTRFLINLDLSRLGALQLDGMSRKESRGFDLMIRTKQPLPETLRQELMGMFGTSTGAMGLKGGLTFQVVKKFADPLGDSGLSPDKSGLWA